MAPFLQFTTQMYTFVAESQNFGTQKTKSNLIAPFAMPTWSIVVLCSVAAVALFVIGMSLTLMIKGHYIDSEISTNKNMQRLGIKCAVQETREADGSADCSEVSSPLPGCTGNCGACDIDHTQK